MHIRTRETIEKWSGGRDKRIKVQGHPGEKLVRPYLKNKPDIVLYACNPSYLGDGGRRITVGARAKLTARLYLKKKKKKKKTP
jgi:hypothetical protein